MSLEQTLSELRDEFTPGGARYKVFVLGKPKALKPPRKLKPCDRGVASSPPSPRSDAFTPIPTAENGDDSCPIEIPRHIAAMKHAITIRSASLRITYVCMR